MKELIDWPAFWTAVILLFVFIGTLILMLLALGSGVFGWRLVGYLLGGTLFSLLFAMFYKLCCVATERLRGRGKM